MARTLHESIRDDKSQSYFLCRDYTLEFQELKSEQKVPLPVTYLKGILKPS